MNRERISISIKSDLLKKIDSIVDGVTIRNRSHAIEALTSQSLGINNISDAIVMAGGETAAESISAIKKSIVGLKSLGIHEIIVALGYLGDKIKKNLGDGKELGVEISYLEGSEGSGGALYLLKNALKKSFVVVNVDDDQEIDYQALVDYHKKSHKIATVATNDIKTMRGVYILEPAVLSYLESGFSMLEEDIFPKLLKDNKVSVYPILN
ncbi:MAG: hypothetical protein BWY19_00874 [bacterium ADurb.Bin212]|nr:MAG: hypothetical protein BWY19_00874 [bacterium ADurb.Bin212]